MGWPRRYGGDAFLRGFWYAYLACSTSGETEDKKIKAIQEFRDLVSNCLADVRVFPTEKAIEKESLQAINDNEEAAELTASPGLE